MRKAIFVGIATFFLAGFVLTGAPARAGMNVNVNIGAPAVVVAQPPEMILVPDSLVYYAPGVEAELFFYRGDWYTRSSGRWYRGRSYEGPWVTVGPRAVPAAFVRLPRNYRTVYVREKHVPYGHLKKHWREREESHRRGKGKDKEERHAGKGRKH
jgi:hypothetical protein